MRNQDLHLFFLKPRVSYNSFLDYVDKWSIVVEIFLNKSFKFGPEQGSYLILILVLVLAETNFSQRKKIANRVQFNTIILVILQ